MSERRNCANRVNAQRSTGPRSHAGKTISSKNAFKHGLTCGRRIDLSDPVGCEAAFRAAEICAAGALSRLASSLGLPLAADDRAGACDPVEIWSAVQELEALERYRTPRLKAWLQHCEYEGGQGQA